ncbi:MAG TPA: DinB family protein [Bryobacteraceae bacterium]|nr:DinB family protein [Bryobacteraceae bacterium]
MEPWMTGSITGVHSLQAALLYCFEHARLDLARWTEGLTTEQLWRRSGQVAPVAFHIVHIGGSVERLMTYAAGKQLSQQQMSELRAEQETHEVTREKLLAQLEEKLRGAEQTLRALDLSDLSAVREIGRKRIPVPLAVLLTHIAEHTQRHVGEAIVTTKIVREA